MSISYRVAKRFEVNREKLIAEFLHGLGSESESEAAYQLSKEFGINVFDARELVEEFRDLEPNVSDKEVLPLVSKYATHEKVSCGCGCGCSCYNNCNCDCGCS